MAIELAQVIHCQIKKIRQTQPHSTVKTQFNLLFLSILRFRSEIWIIKSRFFCTTYQSFVLNLLRKKHID